MIAAILGRAMPWLKWWPLVVIPAAFLAGWHEGDVRCEAAKADELHRELRGYQDEIDRLNAVATKAEASRAAIEKRTRELQRSLSHDQTQSLDACPVGDGIVRALNAGRVRPAPGQPAR